MFYTFIPGREVSHLWLVNPDGSGLRELTRGDVRDRSPTWAPDGRRIAFIRHGAVFVMRADGTDVRQLTRWDQEEEMPDWSPDGRQIVFSRRFDIYVMNADGTDQRLLLADGSYPTWSPDGHKIAFVRHFDGQNRLHVMNADGTGVRVLSGSADGDCYTPAWSSDGQKIAFMSDAAGDPYSWFDIFVINADGTDATALTRDPGMESYPSWRPR